MTLAILLLSACALIAYSVLLGRLANAVRAKKPELFAAIGRPPATDYMLLGFFVGDGFVTKLEAREGELADSPDVRSLMKYVRFAWAAQIPLLLAFIFLVVH